MAYQHQYAEIEAALAAFVPPGQTFEIRLIHHNRKRIDSGYFNSAAQAATVIAGLEEHYSGIYYTPNPVNPDLYARSAGRITSWAAATTRDPDILERRWLLIDIDPDRPSGISSTQEQLDNAFKVATTISGMLEFEGWPKPFINVSGNGCHVLYATQAENTEAIRDSINLFLQTLNGRFKAHGCSVDTSTFNASRIFRLPGTWARKGDSTPDRPHRKSYMVVIPDKVVPVSMQQVRAWTANNGIARMNGSRAWASPPRRRPLDDDKKYQGLNKHAMERMPEWVREYFPEATDYQQGYRVSSAALGQNYEEDLAIHPWPLGIKYFGIADQGDPTEGRRTPVNLIAELLMDGDTVKAADSLASTLKLPITEFSILPNGHASNLGLDSATQPVIVPGITSSAPNYDFRLVPNMGSLQKRNFKAQNWIIPNVLPTGCILLAARPKMRKTFLALQLALAMCGAHGGRFLDWKVTPGEVLFLGLEDNERRLKERIALMQSLDLNPPDLSGFRYWTGGVDLRPGSGQMYVSNPEERERTFNMFPRGQAGVDALESFLDMYPLTRLIVIDTYAHFREALRNPDVYQRDYDQMMPITRMASMRDVCVMPVHHEKKGLASAESADFLEDVSGSSGITGAVDGVISIKGKRGPAIDGGEERKLLISGRDVPHDFDVDMKFDARRGGWLPAARQDAKYSILQLLSRHPYLGQQEIQNLLPQVPRGRVGLVLTTLKHEGHIVQGRAGYSLPNNFKGDF